MSADRLWSLREHIVGGRSGDKCVRLLECPSTRNDKEQHDYDATRGGTWLSSFRFHPMMVYARVLMCAAAVHALEINERLYMAANFSPE